MKNESFFSREALDKLRSPEKLDTLIPVTNPIAWMGLAAVAVMIFAVVLWSIFGSFTEKADGLGMIMDSVGIVNISHAASGKITRIYVQHGSYIHSGDLIAHMERILLPMTETF